MTAPEKPELSNEELKPQEPPRFTDVDFLLVLTTLCPDKPIGEASKVLTEAINKAVTNAVWRAVRSQEASQGKREPKTEQAVCGLCGKPMPKGEEMFQYHGFSGECPK